MAIEPATIRALLIGGELEDHELLTDVVKSGGLPSFSLEHLANISECDYLYNHPPHDIYFFRDKRPKKYDFLAVVERLKASNPFASIVLISDENDRNIFDIAKSKGVNEFLSKNDIKASPMLRIIKNAKERNVVLREIEIVNEKLIAVEKAAGAGIWEWNLYNNSFTWSREQYRLFGIDPHLRPKVEYDTWRSIIHPDDIESVEADLARAIVGKENFNREFRIIYQDASANQISIRWLKGIGSIKRDSNGAAAKMVGINFDITTNVNSMSSLVAEIDQLTRIQKEFRDLFDIFFNSSPDCIVQFGVGCDNNFFYENINPAGLKHTGISLLEVLGKSPSDVLGTEIGSTIEAKLQVVLETRKPVRFQPKFSFVSGSVIYDAVYTPLFSENQSLRGILTCARDITAIHKTEEALRQAQKMEAMGQLASGVAHDFNNVLHTLLTCTQLLGSHVSSDLGKKVLNSARKAVGHGEELCSRLVTFARPKLGSIVEADVNKCIDEMSEIFESVLGQNIILEKELSRNIWLSKVDTQKLELAILNLVINSRDAMENGGVLAIKTKNIKVGSGKDCNGGEFVRISVSDTGCGMSKEVLDQAANIFFTTKPIGHGTGLGLSMVVETIKSMDGLFNIKSEPGLGTSVTLDLPRA